MSVQLQVIGGVLVLTPAFPDYTGFSLPITPWPDVAPEHLAAVGHRVVVDLGSQPLFGVWMLRKVDVLGQAVAAGGGRLVVCNMSDVACDVLLIDGFARRWAITRDPVSCVVSELTGG